MNKTPRTLNRANRTNRMVLADALRVVRSSTKLAAGGVRISYNIGHVTVAGDTYPLRAVLADYGFRFVRHGNVCEWRWTGAAKATPDSYTLYPALRRAQATAQRSPARRAA